MTRNCLLIDAAGRDRQDWRDRMVLAMPERVQRDGDGLRVNWRGVIYRLDDAGFAPDTVAGWRGLMCDPARLGDSRAIAATFADEPRGLDIAPMFGGLLDLGGEVARATGGDWIGWAPARIAVAASVFADAARAFVDGGPFPLPMLVRIAEGDETVASDGLAAFCGQELHLLAAGYTPAERMARFLRLGHRMAVDGGFRGASQGPGLDPGERLAIDAPAAGGGTARATVWRGG